MMKLLTKRILSALIALIMMTSIFAVYPLTVSATENTGGGISDSVSADDGITVTVTNTNVEVNEENWYTTLANNAKTNSQAASGAVKFAFDGNTTTTYHSYYNTTGSDTPIFIQNANTQDLVSKKGGASPHHTSRPIWISTNFGGKAVDISQIKFKGRANNGVDNRPYAYMLYFLKEVPTSEQLNTNSIKNLTEYSGEITGATKHIRNQCGKANCQFDSDSTLSGKTLYYTSDATFNNQEAVLTLGEVQKDVKAFIMVVHSVTPLGDHVQNVVVSDFRFFTPETITYTATVSEGKEFAGWYDDEGNCVSTDTTYTCNAADDKHLNAKTYKNNLTVKLAVDGEEISEIPDVKHVFNDKFTSDEVLDIYENVKEALKPYNSLKNHFNINGDEELAITDDTCTLQITKSTAEYTVTANVGETPISDTKEYNHNFEGITAPATGDGNTQFVGWYISDDDSQTIIATGASYNYVATEDIDITAKYAENSEASNDISVYIPEPVQSIQKNGDNTYNTVEVVVSTTNVANTDSNPISVNENISSFGVVIVPAAMTDTEIKTSITNGGSNVKKAYISGESNNVTLTNKGRYLHTLYFGGEIRDGYKICAFVVDNENNITLSNGRDLQAKAAITDNAPTE